MKMKITKYGIYKFKKQKSRLKVNLLMHSNPN